MARIPTVRVFNGPKEEAKKKGSRKKYGFKIINASEYDKNPDLYVKY